MLFPFEAHEWSFYAYIYAFARFIHKLMRLRIRIDVSFLRVTETRAIASFLPWSLPCWMKTRIKSVCKRFRNIRRQFSFLCIFKSTGKWIGLCDWLSLIRVNFECRMSPDKEKYKIRNLKILKLFNNSIILLLFFKRSTRNLWSIARGIAEERDLKFRMPSEWLTVTGES